MYIHKIYIKREKEREKSKQGVVEDKEFPTVLKKYHDEIRGFN